ncbi:Hsp20/alpha crystallin family protein [Ramlibacter sp. USB13]|uniref:Hsp20/alpha crystallin family protein n=2 Tax=Ramlibacter cellulosilyticus TaxID=2764187 RepID=A0A923MTX3_9BURK|nr:Hsp20/alpha crystallin family protein [Ramlibacter cellulosilyticus]MBC5784921.1 Hsp20/alpha crystallin family protein [Ramlibacter cellulosilyticus]
MFRSSADLFAELNRMQSMLDQVFPSAGTGIRSMAGASFPAINVGTTPTAVEVQALAPGLDPSRLEITVDRGLLVIAGERKSDLPPQGERTSVYANERFTGRFRRVISLPEDADASRVDASYRDGVLRITVAKRESSLPRRIEVN